MKVLITGGSGFIGSHLADRLLNDGHEVVALDNFETGRRDNLAPRDGLTLIEGTIADRRTVDSAFADLELTNVVHAAASYKDPDGWVGDAETNVLGTVNVVRATQAAGLERLIYFQTALCYGTAPREQPVTLDHPVFPDSSYAISKTAGEHYVQMGIPNHVSFRLANVYGPRNVSGPLPTFFDRLNNGRPCFVMDTRRDFIYIDDLVDIVMRALYGEGRGTYHVSSGSDFSIKELFDETLHAMDLELEDEVEVRARGEDDAYTILLDPARTHADFPGWEIRTSLQEGVAQAIAYYRERGIGETFTHLKVPK